MMSPELLSVLELLYLWIWLIVCFVSAALGVVWLFFAIVGGLFDYFRR